ncbi:LOW QUALITY PROTEIN: hypothetical protein PAHAL_9G446900 [Panicum hallii]|uniref:Uncharacterized protein n=1 Tax=Panicum hallii TaxID=206008 RepID=A0A2T8I4P0_9POAL|nr:LOW QUALITY PROTEIN: hypothetical protein PAHAL_9G446900 [Panicum hallii]
MEVEVVRCDQASRLRSVVVVLGAARVAETDAVDGAQAALGLRDDGGREPGLREPAGRPTTAAGVSSAMARSALHRHSAGDGRQLPAARVLHVPQRDREQEGCERDAGAAAGPTGRVPAAARERAQRDGLPRSWRRPWRWRRAGRRTGGDGG